MTKHLRLLAVAFIGGACGTGLRLVVDATLPHGANEFPTSTLVVNVAGSFMLGLIIARFWSKASEWLKVFLASGLMGSFTTFSAVMVSLVAQSASGQWVLAVSYLLATLVLGFSAAALGLRVGRVSTPIDWADE